MSRDRIYAETGKASGPFEFSEEVVRVFPDMIGRSVPGYHLMLEMAGLLARQTVTPDSRVYDLGASLGAATLAVRRSVQAEGVRMIAIDNADAMVQRCRTNLRQDNSRIPVEVRQGDVLDEPIENASLVLMFFTLQFIRPERRQEMVQRIYQGLRPGGVFLLAEKIRFDDESEQAWLTDRHHDFKRSHGYSDLEIARKRQALENVLVPDTRQQHHQRMTAAGFDQVIDWFQCLNFAAFAGFRDA